MAFNEKDNEKLGLILSTVGASIGNWAISQKSMQTHTETSNGENDPPLDFESLKRAICQAVDMLRMFPGFKASMPKSSSSQAVAQIESEATILFPSRFRSPNGDSLSSFEATSLVSSSCRFSDDENSNSSPATASSSEVDMGVSESQEKIDIKQELYSPLEREPNDKNDNQNTVAETINSEEVTKSETSDPDPEVQGSPSKDKTPTKQRKRTNSSSSSSSWCVTPLRKRHLCNQVDDYDDYDDYEDSERTREHRLSNYRVRDDQQEDGYNNDDDDFLKIVPGSNERYVSSEYDKEFMITTTTGSKRSKKSESFSSSSKSSTSSSLALLVNKENKSDRKKSESRKVSIVDTDENKDDNENDENDDRKSKSGKKDRKLSSRERETLKKTGKEYDMKCLFVDNLPEFVTRSELDSLFPKNIQMFLQHNNRLKYSFAFVYFATEKDAEKAKMSVLGKKWKGKLMKVSYSFVWDSSKSSNSGVGDNKSSNQQKAYKRIDNVKTSNPKGKRKVTKPKNY